jgi:hypothetical protein
VIAWRELRNRWFADSALEEGVRSEPVSKRGYSSAILERNKLVFALKIAKNGSYVPLICSGDHL